MYTTYDSQQLLQAADIMVTKLEKYLHQALEKQAAICATILDPCLKMEFFEVSESMQQTFELIETLKFCKTHLQSQRAVLENFDKTPEQLWATFLQISANLAPAKNTSLEADSQKLTTYWSHSFDEEIFGDKRGKFCIW